MNQSYRFTFTCPDTQFDELSGLCYSLGMVGCEEENRPNETDCVCYYTDENQAIATVQYLVSQDITTTKIEKIEEQDWNAKWRESIEPIKISDTIWCSPEWLKPPMEEADYWIKIEPRMAFGTGHHETTRLAANMILSSPTTATSLLDIGTGSGILAFVAEYAGYERISGIEIDPDCRENLDENLVLNRKTSHIDFLIGSVDDLDEDVHFDTIVMNIIRLQAEPLLDACTKHIAPGGQLIWSGLLLEEKERVIAIAREKKWRLIDESSENEWWAARFQKTRIA